MSSIFGFARLTQIQTLYIACSFLILFGPAVQALTLDEALNEAELRAPEIMAGKANENAARALTISAGALPDPKLSIGVDDFPLQGDDRYRLGNSKRSISLMQDIPNSKKRRASQQLAEANAQASLAQNRYARLNVRRETTLAWLSLYYLEQKGLVLDEQEEENRLKRDNSRAVLAGGGSAADVLGAQVEQASLADARDDLNRDIRRARAQLARWVGDELAAQGASGAPPAWLNKEQTINELEMQPDLRAAQTQVSVAQADLAMATADKNPDWGVELGVGQDAMGKNMAMLKFSFTLPIFTGTRQNPKIAAAASAVERADAEHASRRANYRQQFYELLAERDALTSQRNRLIKSTLPLLNKQIELGLANLRGGQGSADTVLAARNTRLSNLLRSVELQSQLAAVKAKLYFLTGGGEHE